MVQLNTAPMALLTASTDRCVKMWGVNGEPMGLLLQGIPANLKNPKWNLVIDVAGREEVRREVAHLSPAAAPPSSLNPSSPRHTPGGGSEDGQSDGGGGGS